MESSDGSKSSKSFFKHVFNFDEDSKGEILNIIQYSLLAIIPIVILNKSMQKFVPEADDEKGSLEILAEVLIQIIVMFLGLLLIDRIITYLPTYSGLKYPEFSIIYIILAILMITLSLQTKLGEKVSILVERITELWEGKKEEKNNNKKNVKNNNIKVSQPISQGFQNQNFNQQAINQSFNDGTSISQLPNQNQNVGTQKLPDYDSMNRNDSAPLVNANAPVDYNEPMAANAALGGGAFSSW